MRWLKGGVFGLVLGLAGALLACQARPPASPVPALDGRAPSPTAAVASPLPSPSSAPGRAATRSAPPTPPWTQRGPWPTPEAALNLHVQVDPAWGPAAMRSALAGLLDADEIWPAAVPAAWPGPPLPPQAQVLVTAYQRDRHRWWVDFTLAPDDLPALQQAVATAGWVAFPNINPDLAQLAPGLVLLEFHPSANTADATLTVFIVRMQGEARLGLRMVWSRDGRGLADAAPPESLPWGLTAPADWQVAPPTAAFDAAGLQAAVSPVAWGATRPEAALSAWDAALQAQGWQPAGRETGPTVAAAAWTRGAERRALVVLPTPGREHDGVLLAEAFAADAPRQARPRWHGDVPPEVARQAAVLAAVLWNPQLAPPLDLAFGGAPPADAPWAAAARLVFARRSGRQTTLWMYLGPDAEAALRPDGWTWRPPGMGPWAVALWGAPWPDPAGPGRAVRWFGGLCRDDAGWLAYGGPDGWWMLSPAGPCPGDAPLAGALPWPAGFPLRAYAALQTQGVGYNTGHTWSLAAFWLPGPSDLGADWLDQAARAVAAGSWTVEPVTPHARLFRVPLGRGDGQALVGAWPLLEGQTLFVVLANR